MNSNQNINPSNKASQKKKYKIFTKNLGVFSF